MLGKKPGEEAGQNPDAAYGDEKPQHPAPGDLGEGSKKNPASGEYFEYIDSYGVEATSKADSKTYIIGNFESFEEAQDFIEWELNHFETLNARVIRHTERTSMEALFIEVIDRCFDYKPPSWESQI